jgi:hypothetical protein
LIHHPIQKALSIVKSSSVRCLVMGGQACVLYGGAEFSRDLDLAISAAPGNVKTVRRAIENLQAERVFFPDLDVAALERGHACHFRCRAPGVENLRIDLMTRMRGCPDFEELWSRRTVVDLPEIGAIDVISLPDLIRAKKTQRSKDWPMIRRLVEADCLQFRGSPSQAQKRFWLLECRTPSLLVEMARAWPDACKELASGRDLLSAALRGDVPAVRNGLEREEEREREADRAYWAPLRAELEEWRREGRETVGKGEND